MPHRFYVPPNQISEDSIRFSDEQHKQIKNVLRLRQGDMVRVFDGSGIEYGVHLEKIDNKATGHIYETKEPDVEPKVQVTLVQSVPKGEKVDLILQKCTEIGISKFIFMETTRTISRIAKDKIPFRLERWRAIVKEAAEQSGRTKLPSVEGIISFKDAIEIGRRETSLIAWECEKDETLLSVLPKLLDKREIACFVGPEGGFASEEIALAVDAGITPVSLGPRVLRTETAAIVAAALLIYVS